MRSLDDWAPSVRKAVELALGGMVRGCRHDTMVAAAGRLARLHSLEFAGAEDAWRQVRAGFIDLVAGERNGEKEADEAWDYAVDKVKTESSRVPAKGERIAEYRRQDEAIYAEIVRSSVKGGRVASAAPPSGAEGDTGEVRIDQLVVPTSWSDAHVGEAFGVTLEGRWLYCRALGGWQQWDGRRWRTDPGEAVFEEFRRWIIDLGAQLWRADGNDELMKKVARYRDRGKIDAAVTIARRLPNIAARVDEFDIHPHLLNCLNGVVDLRTGERSAPDPALRIRQLAGAAFVPGATHGDVEAVLAVMTPTVQPWVQRLIGSAAVGSVVDDIVAVFDGNGANGKTTLLKGVANALGDYATSASTRLLIARAAHDDHPTLIADLFGRRLVYIEETPEGGALKMEQLKALSGGTEIKARFIGKDQFSFTPTHQFVIATNHRPAVNASDHAAWRRLRLVPFPRTYRKSHEARPGDLVADLGLRTRLTYAAQREALLAWIVAGAVEWHRSGLGGCPEIDEATDRWRKSEDVIEAWWSESIVPAGDGSVPASRVYESFTNWCRLNGRPAASNKEFAKKLMDHDLYQRHGIERRDAMAGRVYVGLKLTSEGLLKWRTWSIWRVMVVVPRVTPVRDLPHHPPYAPYAGETRPASGSPV